MKENQVAVARKALTYAILCDLVRGSIVSLGSVNTADSGKTAAIVYDEVTKAAKNAKK